MKTIEESFVLKTIKKVKNDLQEAKGMTSKSFYVWSKVPNLKMFALTVIQYHKKQNIFNSENAGIDHLTDY